MPRHVRCAPREPARPRVGPGGWWAGAVQRRARRRRVRVGCAAGIAGDAPARGAPRAPRAAPRAGARRRDVSGVPAVRPAGHGGEQHGGGACVGAAHGAGRAGERRPLARDAVEHAAARRLVAGRRCVARPPVRGVHGRVHIRAGHVGRGARSSARRGARLVGACPAAQYAVCAPGAVRGPASRAGMQFGRRGAMGHASGACARRGPRGRRGRGACGAAGPRGAVRMCTTHAVRR